MDRETLAKVLNILTTIISVEYGNIIYYSQMSACCPERALANSCMTLGQDSIKHLNQAADLIKILGGGGEVPSVVAEPFKEGASVLEMAQHQLEKEKLALWLYTQAADLVDNPGWQSLLRDIGQMEARHIEILNNIITQLIRQSP